jgi:hypothetical protein
MMFLRFKAAELTDSLAAFSRRRKPQDGDAIGVSRRHNGLSIATQSI